MHFSQSTHWAEKNKKTKKQKNKKTKNLNNYIGQKKTKKQKRLTFLPINTLGRKIIFLLVHKVLDQTYYLHDSNQQEMHDDHYLLHPQSIFCVSFPAKFESMI